MVNRAHKAVYKKRKFDEAKTIVKNELFKEHMTYDDLKTSEMKMEFLRITKDQTMFRESLDYFNN